MMVTAIAPKNPVLCRALINNQATIKTIIQATTPPRNKNVSAYTIVITKAVKNTDPNSVCLALLKKLNAILRKIAIIIRKIK